MLAASLEDALNQILDRDRCLKAARQYFRGRSLVIFIAELKQPVTLIFTKLRVNVVCEWHDKPDCTIKIRLAHLPKLRDRQQLMALIYKGEIEVQGDLQLIQQFSSLLLDLAELAPAEYLAAWVGDITAEGLIQIARRSFNRLRRDLRLKQSYLEQTLTEEWRLALGTLEFSYFREEVEALTSSLDAFNMRLTRLEGLNDLW